MLLLTLIGHHMVFMSITISYSHIQTESLHLYNRLYMSPNSHTKIITRIHIQRVNYSSIYMPQAGFKPGSSRERLLEFDTHSKPLGHHCRLHFIFIVVQIVVFEHLEDISNKLRGPYNRGYLVALLFFRGSWETRQPRYKNKKNNTKLIVN